MAATGGASRVAKGLVVFVVGAAAMLAAAFGLRVAISERILAEVLAGVVPGPVTLRVEALEADHAIVAGIELPAMGVAVRRIRVDFAIGELFDRHVRRIQVQDVSMDVDGHDGLPPLPKIGGGGPAPRWTVGTVLLEGARVVVRAPAGAADVALTGAVRRIAGDRYSGTAAFSGSVAPEGGEAVPVSGRAEFRGTTEVLDSATIEAVATEVRVPWLDAREVRLAGTLTAGMLALRLDAPFPEGSIDVAFRGPLPSAPDPSLITGEVTLSADNLPLPALSASRVEATATLEAGSIAIAGTLAADEGSVAIAAEAPVPPDFAALPQRLRADVRIALAGLAVPGTPGPLAVSGRIEGGVEGKALAIRVIDDLRARMDVAGERIAIRVQPSDTPLLRTADVFSPEAPLEVRADVATVLAVGQTLDLLGADAQVRVAPATEIVLRTVRIDPNRPELTSPVDGEGRAILDGGAVHFAGRFRAADGVVVADVGGRHHLDTATGEAQVSLARVDFIPGLFQPADLSSAVPAAITEVRGGIEAGGDITWGAGGIASELAIRLHRLGFKAAGVLVEGIAGSIAVDRPWPLRTPPDQTVTIERVVAGVPLTNGTVRFRIGEHASPTIGSADFEVLGGRLALDGMAFSAAAGSATGTVRIGGIGVQRLIDLAEIDGTSASGQLAGTLPITVSAAGVSVGGGRLSATSPGVLRYAPPVPPASLQGGGEGVSLMLEALKNFHYEVLGADIDGEAGGEWLAALRLSGKNPDFMDGYPFELNFNLSGRLDAILRDGMKGFSLPERLGEGLSGTRP